MNSEQRRPHGQDDRMTTVHDAIPLPVGSHDAAERILQSLRDELDSLDRTLLETLRQRLNCCCRIGLHKRDHAIPMMQPQRIGVVQARAAAFAAEHGMSPAFLHALYELIIAETCRLEDEIIGAPATSE
ncbi:chorismate mutase [Variovorax sp. YR750]|uniref:chorismate mutase family protein n=1 Tax=Variovorax sp. YR750 TaxID=1884384 RepID=UPI0008CBD307|nr:chorismate mutase family protein [Variovorax sp. YR750]SEM43468.1 chorismate mutase [Variovorax sp. YR750]